MNFGLFREKAALLLLLLYDVVLGVGGAGFSKELFEEKFRRGLFFFEGADDVALMSQYEDGGNYYRYGGGGLEIGCAEVF